MAPRKIRFCSDRCRIRAHYRRKQGAPMSDSAFYQTRQHAVPRLARDYPPTQCLCCGEPISFPRVCWCSANCRARAIYRRRVGRPISDAAFDQGETATCVDCHMSFTRYCREQLYCSRRCQDRAERRRRKERKIA